MKATIVKIPHKYLIAIGEGKDQRIVFARTGYQCAEVANANGATETEMGTVECLSITPMASQSQPSSPSSPSDSAGTKSKGGKSRS